MSEDEDDEVGDDYDDEVEEELKDEDYLEEQKEVSGRKEGPSCNKSDLMRSAKTSSALQKVVDNTPPTFIHNLLGNTSPETNPKSYKDL